MINEISLLFFQKYWWFLVSILAGLYAFLIYVPGGQTLINQIGKTDSERKLLFKTLESKWGITFTVFMAFVGTFFAAFPLFFSTSFGGAYWAWIIILLTFTVQTICFEFITKQKNALRKNILDVIIFSNSLLGSLFIGIVLGTFFNGAAFGLNEINTASWLVPTHGLEAAQNFHNLALGISLFFLSRTIALLYFTKNISNENILKTIKKQILYNAIPLTVFFLYFFIVLMQKDGFAFNPETGKVNLEAFKYYHNFLEMPIVLVLFLIGFCGVLFGIIRTILSKNIYKKGIWFSGIGTFLVVFTLLLIAGYNNTAFYPSLHELNDSLTIQNASSSLYSLKIMSIISIFVPFVFAYIVYVWITLNKKRSTN